MTKGWLPVLVVLAMGLAVSALRAEDGPFRYRYGVGVATQNMIDGRTTVKLSQFEGYGPGDEPFNPLGLGWYFNWSWKGSADPVPGIEYMPLVGGWRPGVNPSISTIAAEVAAYPERYPDGTTWLIGNEIVWDDQRTPEKYAEDYHDFYHGLKAINPTFKVAMGAIITSVYYNRANFKGTPYELMDAIWNAYQDLYGVPWPVDVYRIHPYIWKQDGDTVQKQLDRFRDELLAFRGWMAGVGEQGKPLIITEYGLLHFHEPEWMEEYLLGSFRILESEGHPYGMPGDHYRLVQRWAWFVMNQHLWEAGGAVQWEHCKLFDGVTFTIDPLGEAYRASWRPASWMQFR